MRVLMVSEDIPNPHLGGLGQHVLALAQALHARGHQVDLLGNARHPIRAHPEQQGPGRFLAALHGYERGWKQQRLGAFHAFAQWANARPLKEAILQHAPGYDIVHYHGHLPWVAADLPLDLPFLQTRHDQGGDCMVKTRYIEGQGICRATEATQCARCATPAPNALQQALSAHAVRDMRKRTLRAFERHPVVFVSSFLQRNFARVAPRTVPGSVLPNAVNTAQLMAAAAQPAPSPPPGPLRLFSAGALFGYKGFEPLLQALQDASSGRDFRLRLAGSGPLEASLRARFASPQIEFLGWCDYPRVLAEVLAAEALIVPSLCEESCATSVLEGLALGKTVYALAEGGTPEMQAYASTAGGSLRLFADLPALARAVLEHPVREAVPPQPERFENGMAQLAERVEALYLQRRAQPVPSPLEPS